MIILEDEKEKEELKEQLFQEQLKEESILMLVQLINTDHKHIIQMLDNHKNDFLEQEEKDILYNKIYKETKEFENLLLGINHNHSQKRTELEEKQDKIRLSQGGAITEYITKDIERRKTVPPNKPMFEKVEELLAKSKYNWMKVRRTFDYNKWQIVDSKNRVRFEGTPQTILETVREITQ